MICPKCEREHLKKICFKKNNSKAFLCDFCGTLWYEHEEISTFTGHRMQSYEKDKDLEYTFDEVTGEDPDSKSADKNQFK